MLMLMLMIGSLLRLFLFDVRTLSRKDDFRLKGMCIISISIVRVSGPRE